MKIPPKNRPEWQDLLTEQINVPLKNFFFQMKITQAKNQLAKNKISLEEAVDELYDLCVKFSKAKYMDTDIQNIFYADDISTQNKDKTSEIDVIDDIKQKEPEPTKKDNKLDKLEQIRLQEQQAKIKSKPVNEPTLTESEQSKESESNKSQIDRIKIEAERAIRKRYELEVVKRKNLKSKEEISTEQTDKKQQPVNDLNSNKRNVPKEKMKLRRDKKRKTKKKAGKFAFLKKIFSNG